MNHLGSAGICLAGRELQIRIDDYSPEEIQWIAYYAKEMTSLVIPAGVLRDRSFGLRW